MGLCNLQYIGEVVQLKNKDDNHGNKNENQLRIKISYNMKIGDRKITFILCHIQLLK